MSVEIGTAIIGLEMLAFAIMVISELTRSREADRRMEEDHHAMMASLRGLRERG